MRYTGRGKRRSRVFPVLTLAAAVAADPSDGSGQGCGPMIAPPCLNCPDRRIGCHDPAVCPKWADYENIHKAELAARPSYREREDMVEYIKDRRRRYMPGRWKKGDKSC